MELPKISELFSRLEKSEAFENFKNQNKDAFFCAGFFILNFKQNQFEYSLDFRDNKTLFAFKISSDEKENIVFTEDKLLENQKPLDRVSESEAINAKPGLEDLREILKEELLKNNIKNTLDEAIAVIQVLDNKLVWHITCICSTFVIVTVIIEAKSKKILKFDKKSLMDFASIRKPEKK
jgi:hypothetical protein